MDYTDKDYFAIRSALNEAAAGQQTALNKVQARTDTTVDRNIDYFKLLTDQATQVLAPYNALAQQGSSFYFDSLGVNGPQRQQAAIPQATNIFNQQGINAAPLIQSIPGWSFNTAANQSASFMNSMFGYGTSQPTQQQSNQIPQQQYSNQMAPQQQQYSNRNIANDPWAAKAGYQAYQPPAPIQNTNAQDDRAKQLADLQAKQAAFVPNAEFKAITAKQAQLEADRNLLQSYSSNLKVNPMSNQTMNEQLALSAKYGDSYLNNRIPQLLSDTNKQLTQLIASPEYKNLSKQYQSSLVKDGNNGNFKEQVVNPYDAEIAKFNNTASPTSSNFKAARTSGTTANMQGNTGAQNRYTPQKQGITLNQPELQNQQNNELIGFTNQFKNAQNSVNDVAGNSRGALGQILGDAQAFGNNALGSNFKAAGNQLLNRFNSANLNDIMQQATTGANASTQANQQYLNQDSARSNGFLDSIQREINNSVTNNLPQNQIKQQELQNKINNGLTGFTDQFKNTQNYTNDVAGNSRTALNQILGDAKTFGNNALGTGVQDAGNQLLNKFNSSNMNNIMQQGISGANQLNKGNQLSLDQDTLQANKFLDAIQREVKYRPDAVAEANRLTQSSLDMGNKQAQQYMTRGDDAARRFNEMTSGDFSGKILNDLLDPATGAVSNWLNSDMLKNIMDSTVGAGSTAVQNAQAARGMLNSGQTLAELQKVGVNAAGQYMTPVAGQIANNVLSSGVSLNQSKMQGLSSLSSVLYGAANDSVNNVLRTNSESANNRLNNYYNLLGKGAEFAQSAMSNRTANQAQLNSTAGQFANMGAGLASQAGQLGAGMINSDQANRAGLMGQSVSAGNNIYNSNLGARTGMATSGLNFDNSLIQTNAQTANNKLNSYTNLLGQGNSFAQSAMNNRTANQAQTNALTGQFAGIGSGLASQAGQFGSSMLSSDYAARAGLMGQSMGVGNNLYNSNLGAMTGMATTGLNFGNSIMQQQTGMTNNLADKYSGIGNQFQTGLMNNSNQAANTQNALSQGGLSQLLGGGQTAATDTAKLYSQLAGQYAGQTQYGNDIYGNTALKGAAIEASRAQQAQQLQMLEQQYEQKAKNKSALMGMNAGGALGGMLMMGMGML